MAKGSIKLEVLIPLPILILFIGAVFSGARTPAGANRTQSNSQVIVPPEGPPVVLTKSQPDSPMGFSDIVLKEGPNPQRPTTDFKVVNTSGRQIIAFAIRHDAALLRSNFSGSIFENIPDRRRALRPGQTASEDIKGIDYGEPILSITLSIDFVAFSDGTTWGEDTYKGAEELNGFKTGLHEEGRVLLHFLQTSGDAALPKALEEITPEATNSIERSHRWLLGFRSGISWLRSHMRQRLSETNDLRQEIHRLIDEPL